MEKKKYFTLTSESFLVQGALRGAIYNLNSGSIYSVDYTARRILERLEAGEAIRESISDIPNISQKEIVDYLKIIEEKGLGKFVLRHQESSKIQFSPSKEKLKFLWVELTEQCNLNCVHCYAESGFKEKLDNHLTFSDWVPVLREARNLGCDYLQFTGGEPFLFGERIFDLMKIAKSLDYSTTEVFTNGTLLTKEYIQKLKTIGATVAISFYSNNQEVHDRITQQAGSYYKTLETIRTLQHYGIPTRVSVIAMKANQNTLGETINFLKNDLKIKNCRWDTVRPAGRGCNSELLPEKILPSSFLTKPDFPKITPEVFAKRQIGHNCFSSNLCIDPHGDTFPCIMERDIKLGNVKEKTIRDILIEPSAIRVRRLNKDKIETCQDCEYRYACFDCRPKAKNWSGGNLYTKPSYCFYDLYTGEWKEKPRKFNSILKLRGGEKDVKDKKRAQEAKTRAKKSHL